MRSDKEPAMNGPTERTADFGIRPGEIMVDLPAAPDAGVYFIGRIRTPWTERKECPKNGRESTAVCTVELDPRFAPGRMPKSAVLSVGPFMAGSLSLLIRAVG